jgi:hypothetical protein
MLIGKTVDDDEDMLCVLLSGLSPPYAVVVTFSSNSMIMPIAHEVR